MALQHLHSSTANKRPTPGAMSVGQLAINLNTASPGLFFKDSAGALIKVGPVHVGTTAPNASPASGGETGNTVGEQWLDTTGGTYVFKVWDGAAWRSEAGEFVNVTGDTMTGALGVIAGSASTPGLFFSGDANSGLYSPGADQVAISTGGSGRLFINSNGDVGVGTGGTQGTKLHAVGGNIWSGNFYEVGRFQKSSGTAISLGYDNSDYVATVGAYSHDGTPSNLSFWTYPGSGAVQERLRITSAGLVGVGTSSPSSPLHVIGIGRFASSSTAGNFLQVQNSDLTSLGYIGVEGPTGGVTLSGTTANAAFIASGASGSSLQLGSAGVIRATLDSSGRLGIGSTAPSKAFVVSSSGAQGIELSPNDAGGGTNRIISYNRNTSAYTDLLIEGLTLQFQTNNGNERFRCDSSGRLLVGTSSAVSGVAGFSAPYIQAVGTFDQGSILSRNTSNDNTNCGLIFQKIRGSSAVQSEDYLGEIRFNGYDGTADRGAAQIFAQVDGTPGAGDMPGRLMFSTTADGASFPTERMRIGSNGAISLSPSGTTRGVIVGNAFYDPVNAAGIQIANSTGTGRSLSAVNGSGALQDNYMNLGDPATRWGTVYAATGTINTSDANLKQDVEDLDTAELNVANAIKGLIKKFRFVDAVAEKGSDARIHVGVIAQEVEQAFVDEGLDPRRYGLFCEDTLKDGSKRLGIRYDELLAFVVAAL